MKTNKEKFLNLVSEEDTQTMEMNKWRISNRKWLRASQDIAFMVLEKLDELGWTQKKLAEKMEVSPQQVNKIVKGSENLTLETIVKLQNVLNLPLLASFKEESAPKTNIVHYQHETTISLEEMQLQDVCSCKSVWHDFSKKYQDSQIYNPAVNEN